MTPLSIATLQLIASTCSIKNKQDPLKCKVFYTQCMGKDDTKQKFEECKKTKSVMARKK